MANREETSIDIGALKFETGEHEHHLLTLAGTDDIAKGTILARHSGTGKFSLFVKGGSSNGNGIPKGVLTHDVSRVGAGDVPVSVLTKGTVNQKRLIIDADGDDSNIDAAVLDQLRDYGITPVDVEQVGGASFTDEDS